MTARQDAIRTEFAELDEAQGRRQGRRGGVQGADRRRPSRGGARSARRPASRAPRSSPRCASRPRPRRPASSSTATPRSRPSASRRSPRCAPRSARWPPTLAGRIVGESLEDDDAQQPRGRPVPRRPRDAGDLQGRGTGRRQRTGPADAARRLRRGAGRPERGSSGDSARWPTPRRSGRSCSAWPRVLRSEPALRRIADRRLGRGRGQGRARRAACSARRSATRRSRLVKEAVQRRWTRLARPGRRARAPRRRSRSVRSAGQDGSRVSDELFAVRQLVDTSPELRSALSDPAAVGPDKQRPPAPGCSAARSLPATHRLVEQAVSGTDTARRPRRCVATSDIAADAAGREGRDRAHRARAERRPRAAGSRRARQAVRPPRSTSTSWSSPTLVGGLRVEIGDDVIDGTVANRLDDARRRIAG